MTAHTFYRISVWLPLLVPGVVAVAVHGWGLMPGSGPLQTLVQLLLMSLIYGGIPYAALAIWGTIWVDRRPEREIRRRALLAPLLMVAVWLLATTVFAILSREGRMSLALAGLGAVVIIPLGYAYVAKVMLLRRAMDRWIDPGDVRAPGRWPDHSPARAGTPSRTPPDSRL